MWTTIEWLPCAVRQPSARRPRRPFSNQPITGYRSALPAGKVADLRAMSNSAAARHLRIQDRPA